MGTRVILVVHSNTKSETDEDGGAAEYALLREVQTAAGYQSASSPWLSFGLGMAREYATLTVLWPSGRREVLPAGAANRRITVREGEGIVQEERL